LPAGRGLSAGLADVTDASREATTVIVSPHAALRPLAHDPVFVAGS
jgi:hypothetical protein